MNGKNNFDLIKQDLRLLFLLLTLFISVDRDAYAQGDAIPRLIVKGTASQLMVDEKPFLIFGGELGNSSASSLNYMQPIWSTLNQMNLNTVLIPVYWELMEPREGMFDFSLIDSLVDRSRADHLKVILLWFGSWKNSMSCYVPAWVKTNPLRFTRAEDHRGKGLEILSAFSEANMHADATAFSALMHHLKEKDKAHTVLMIQVENEIGMLTEAKEYTREAKYKFNEDVPSELLTYLVKNKEVLVPELKEHWSKNGFLTKGNWEKVFGNGLATDELFQAWYYAKYANTVATAGKKEYPLPMFVNAALNHRNVLPGQYPSAGPLPHLLDIWQAGAPVVDFLSPDFYNPRFKQYNDLYTRRNNPLFIPEIKLESSDATTALYAIGHYHALGISPFSVESAKLPDHGSIAKSYDLLDQLSHEIALYTGSKQMDAVLLDTSTKKQELVFGDYTLTLSHDYTLGWSPEAQNASWPEVSLLIIQTSADDFIIAGTGGVVTFKHHHAPDLSVGILQAEEGVFKNQEWIAGRRMNGDQDHQGRHIRIPVGEWSIQKVKLYTYK